MKCPTCNSQITELPGFVFYPEKKYLCIDGNDIPITPAQAELLSVITDYGREGVSVDHIMDRMYWDSENPPYPKIISVYIHRLNQKFRLFGTHFRIQNCAPHVYRLIVLAEEEMKLGELTYVQRQILQAIRGNNVISINGSIPHQAIETLRTITNNKDQIKRSINKLIQLGYIEAEKYAEYA